MRANAVKVSVRFASNSASKLPKPLLEAIEFGLREDVGRLKLDMVLFPKSIPFVALANETLAPLANVKLEIPSIVPLSILAFIRGLLLKSIPLAYLIFSLLFVNSMTSFPAKSYIFLNNTFLLSITAKSLENIAFPFWFSMSI